MRLFGALCVVLGISGTSCASGKTPDDGYTTSPCGVNAHLYEGNCVANGYVDSGPPSTPYDGGSGGDGGDVGDVSPCQSFAAISPNIAMAYLSRIAGFPSFVFPTTWTSSGPVCEFTRPSSGAVASSFQCTFTLSNGSQMFLQFFDNPYPNPQDSSFTDTSYIFGLPDAGNSGVLQMDLIDAEYDGGSPPYWCGTSGGSGSFQVVSATYNASETADPDHIVVNYVINCPAIDASITGCVSATE